MYSVMQKFINGEHKFIKF